MEQEHQVGASDVEHGTKLRDEVAEAFSIGEPINGQYSVVSRTSEGPTGTLYRAQSLKTSSELTLKLLHGWSGADKPFIQRLTDELSVTRTLAKTQPAIAQVHGVDQTADGRTFVVLERLEGRNLAELIRWQEPLSIERAMDLTIQVARALQAAHTVRLFHGALGAEHVLVQYDDAVKVLGFEVARHEAATRPSIHTPPERLNVLSVAGDTRALAMLLLEMLTAAVRPGPDGAALHPEAPRGGDVPREIKEVVMRALVTSPVVPSLDMGGLAAALSAELRRRREPPRSRVSWRLRRSARRPTQWTRIGVRAVAIVAIASAGLTAWSLVTKTRPPATHEMPRGSADAAIPHLASPGSDTMAQPQSGLDVAGLPTTRHEAMPPDPWTNAAVTPAPTHAAPEAESPAIDGRSPVAPPRPGELAPRRPEVGSARPGSEALPPRAEAAPAAEAPAIARPIPGAQRRPGEPATRRPGGGSARPESEAPDPSAIIDWLLGGRGRQPDQP